jgi:hypothetical protein
MGVIFGAGLYFFGETLAWQTQILRGFLVCLLNTRTVSSLSRNYKSQMIAVCLSGTLFIFMPGSINIYK